MWYSIAFKTDDILKFLEESAKLKLFLIFHALVTVLKLSHNLMYVLKDCKVPSWDRPGYSQGTGRVQESCRMGNAGMLNWEEEQEVSCEVTHSIEPWERL